MNPIKKVLFTEKDCTEVENHFRESFLLGTKIQGDLRGVLQDSLDYPGSLIRGQLAYKLMTEANVDSVISKDIAIAMEYFHLASLLFDDLSCMDDATYRRGHLCVHKKYGEAAAILGALAFINRAYALIWAHEAKFESSSKAKMVQLLDECLGPAGILNGQAHDLFYSQAGSDRESVTEIAKGKTVSLIRISLLLPAILSGSTEAENILLNRIVHFVGLAYQILDDFKDVSESLQVVGKTTHRDKALSRPNYVLALGASTAYERLKRFENLNAICVTRLKEKSKRWDFLQGLQQFLDQEIGALQPLLLRKNLKAANQ